MRRTIFAVLTVGLSLSLAAHAEVRVNGEDAVTLDFNARIDTVQGSLNATGGVLQTQITSNDDELAIINTGTVDRAGTRDMSGNLDLGGNDLKKVDGIYNTSGNKVFDASLARLYDELGSWRVSLGLQRLYNTDGEALNWTYGNQELIGPWKISGTLNMLTNTITNAVLSVNTKADAAAGTTNAITPNGLVDISALLTAAALSMPTNRFSTAFSSQANMTQGAWYYFGATTNLAPGLWQLHAYAALDDCAAGERVDNWYIQADGGAIEIGGGQWDGSVAPAAYNGIAFVDVATGYHVITSRTSSVRLAVRMGSDSTTDLNWGKIYGHLISPQ